MAFSHQYTSAIDSYEIPHYLHYCRKASFNNTKSNLRNNIADKYKANRRAKYDSARACVWRVTNLLLQN